MLCYVFDSPFFSGGFLISKCLESLGSKSVGRFHLLDWISDSNESCNCKKVGSSYRPNKRRIVTVHYKDQYFPTLLDCRVSIVYIFIYWVWRNSISSNAIFYICTVTKIE